MIKVAELKVGLVVYDVAGIRINKLTIKELCFMASNETVIHFKEVDWGLTVKGPRCASLFSSEMEAGDSIFKAFGKCWERAKKEERNRSNN